MNAMSLSPQGLRDVPVGRRRQRSRPAALHHPLPERVNLMRHGFITGAVTSSASRMQMAAATGALIAPAGVAHARPPHRPGALGCAIALTAIATTTDQHLGPAAGTQEQAARGLHRRSPANAEDKADVRLDGCAMAAILRATQSPSADHADCWWIGTGAAPASLCRVTTAPRLWSLQRPFLSAEAGALRNPGQLRAPPSPSWGNTSSAIRTEVAARSISPRVRCRQIYAVLESHRQ